MSMRMEIIDRGPIDTGRPWTGWTVLAAFVISFAVVFAVNGLMVYYALSTFSGEQEASPYEHGLAYDRDIAAAHAQDARGWHVDISARRPAPGAPADIVADLRDAAGQPIKGLSVVATLEFPADKAFDKRAALTEAAPGEYRAAAPLRPGQWDLVVEASQDGERRFRSRNRVDLP